MTHSEAYDFARFSAQDSVSEESKLETKVKVIKNKSLNQGKRTLRIECVLLCAVVMMLMAYTVYGRLVLTETKTRITAVTNDLTELESANTYLNYKLESMISRQGAEQYATENLGLIKFDSSQTEYVNLQKDNVIENNTVEARSLLEQFFDSVIEAFSGK